MNETEMTLLALLSGVVLALFFGVIAGLIRTFRNVFREIAG